MPALTLLHVAISLIAIGAGFPLLAGLLAGRHSGGTAATFLVLTFLTSLTGFLFFPLSPVLPSHIVGGISIVLLAIAAYALYARGLAGAWRRTYAVTSVLALYLNVFVLVVQAFLRVPALKAAAPTQSELPFLVAQTLVLVVFVGLCVASVARFRPDALAARVRR